MAKQKPQEILDDTAQDLTELVIDLPADFEEQMAEANKPPLDVGVYLATVVGVAPKLSADKGGYQSKGLDWSLLINSNPDSVEDGWDTDAKAFPYKHYTYIGKVVNGKLIDTDKGGMTRDMAGALDIKASFALSAVKNRQILVNIVHVPSLQDEDALRQDPNHEVERYYFKVKNVKPYILDGVRGPKNENLAD